MAFIVKNTTFPNLLDLIAPHSCLGCGRTGNILCERCKNHIIENHKNICPSCKTETPTGQCPDCDLPTIYTIGARTDLIDDLIHKFKYDSARAIGRTFAEILNQIIPPLPQDSVIVPLPTSRKHIRSRGLDHTKIIAGRLAKLRGISTKPVLLRAKDTTQVGADRATRLSQADSAYTINPKIKVAPSTTYILLDDVWTTGASMEAAIKKISAAGAEKIIIILLAVSQLD